MLERVKNTIRKYGHALLFSGVLTALFVLAKSNNPSKSIFLADFQQTFLAREQALNADAERVFNDWKTLTDRAFEKRYSENNTSYFIHIYQHDSLIFWNTNQLPVSGFADLHFPVDGLVTLQNGWYYSKILSKGDLKCVVTFGIQRTYPYENERLSNRFFDPFTNTKAQIRIDELDEHMIKNRNGEPLFRLELEPEQAANVRTNVWMFALSLFLVIIAWHQLLPFSTRTWWRLVLAGALILLRICSFYFDWYVWLGNTPLSDARILALNEWIPNLGELLQWSLLLVLLYFTFSVNLKPPKWTPWLFVGSVVLLIGLQLVLPALAHSIVENSSIPLQLNEIFSLDRYSCIVLLLIGTGGLLYVALSHRLFLFWKRSGWNVKQLTLVFIIVALLVIGCAWCIGYSDPVATFWTVALSAIAFVVVVLRDGNWGFTSVLVSLLIFSTATASKIEREAIEKEKQERELFANELADDRDISAEVEFVATEQKLLKESYLERLVDKTSKPSFTELKYALERRVFDGFWERYDIDCYYFGVDSVVKVMNGLRQYDLDVLIDKHGKLSETDSSLFYIRDYTSQFNYIFRESLNINGNEVCLYGTMKSKRIPEEIGFPRLLISDQTNVFESLEGYSIAKYYKNQLVTNYGDYSYPVGFESFQVTLKGNKTWFDENGYNHFLLKRTKDDAIILSIRNTSLIDWITTIAFLLVSYGFLLAVILWWQFRRFRTATSHLTLAVKIQLVMIGLVVISLLGFSIGSSTFIKNQYSDYTTDLIREKIRSVNREAMIDFNEENQIRVLNNQDELEFQLRNWSQVFITDLNVYTPNGNLLAASRPKIYNIGLVSEQMHPEAIRSMIKDKNSEFIHQENIGNLRYLSAYVPLRSDEGALLGYLNLQHFDQQNVFENQVQRFFIAIINVFMLLLVLSIIGAIAVSSWITAPLRLIRKSFSRVELGKNIQRIQYNSQDEIGDLIAEYNNKLVELEAAAFQLAQTERESAWREMAKQVAHEIKNPLTPMKLSIQQLQRVFDPNDPRAAEKVQRVSQSIIEQIDALTSIANAFSNFAKLPQPVMTHLEVNALVKSVSSLFDADEVGKIQIICGTEELFVQGDREMLLRVINNLITNGIQAVPLDRKAEIHVSVRQQKSVRLPIEIRVADNGMGIPPEQQATIFEPYFTTKSTGTGLGLAMVKQIVESHGGEISIERTGQSGTVMLVALPAFV